MRKLVLFTALLASFTINAIAQTYYPVTHTSGSSVIAGNTVTVTSLGTVATPSNYCGAGPYFIGATNTPGTLSGYQFNFAPANATHIRINVTDFQLDDSVEISVNGSSYTVTNGMITPFAGCTDGTSATASGGRLACTAGPGIRTDATLTFSTSPGFMSSVAVSHYRRDPNSGGVIFSMEFAVDSCLQAFSATADSPACRERTIQLMSTNFPNTTYQWTTTATTANYDPSNTVYNPKLTNLLLPQSSGSYFVTATRGACVYRDTVIVDVKNKPIATTMTNFGPKCAGEEDTVRFISGLGGGGTTYIIKPNGQVVQCILPTSFDYILLPAITLADQGIYKGYSISTEGCYSDTLSTSVTLSPAISADFSFSDNLGCSTDTIKFTDQSTGANVWRWEFGDGGTSSIDNPTHIYTFQPATYTVELWVSNGKCADSMTKQVILDHPLFDSISADFDSVCQNKLVTFTNFSTGTPATQPQYFWDFKDGTTSTQYNETHIFKYYGVYDVSMTITDHLGCKKTAIKRVVVDSLGSASFFSDTVICNGQNIKFLGDYSLIGGTYAEWDFSDGHYIRDKFSIEHAYDQPGTYNVKLTANYRICPDTTYEQFIRVKPFPTIDLGKDTSLCPDGNPFILKDITNTGSATPLKWRWNTATKDSTSYIEVHHPGKYAVTVDQEGCIASDTIEVKKNCFINIPNVFTPNGDGYNDYFLPRQLLSRSVTKFSMNIYNRWGDIVFETNSTNGRGWDGKLNDKEQPGGVYVYLIKVTFANGYSENYQGNITLLR